MQSTDVANQNASDFLHAKSDLFVQVHYLLYRVHPIRGFDIMLPYSHCLIANTDLQLKVQRSKSI